MAKSIRLTLRRPTPCALAEQKIFQAQVVRDPANTIMGVDALPEALPPLRGQNRFPADHVRCAPTTLLVAAILVSPGK